MSNKVKEKITADDWKQIEEILKSFFNIVRLRCDEFEITLKLERVSTFNNAIFVYVNGEIRGEWLVNDCEERRRFYRGSTRTALTSKQREMYKKITRSKKALKELEEKAKYTVYRAHWTSFSSLKRHLLTNNEVVQWIVEEKEG